MSEMSFTNSDLPVALTVSASDSGSGSGIQADLKTFNNLGVFGVTAITCITAQTPSEIRSISPLAPDLVHEQIRAVSDGFPIAVAKTGMLYNRDIILAVARADVSQGIPILVVDPEMVSSTGIRLLQPDAIEALRAELIPLARVVTPNVYEAEILSGMKITSIDELAKAARAISEMFDVACVAKGGSLQGDTKVDVLCDEGVLEFFRSPRVDAPETHGAGCVFSAALAAYLARGELMVDAVSKAKQFVVRALRAAPLVGHHRPLNLLGT